MTAAESEKKTTWYFEPRQFRGTLKNKANFLHVDFTIGVHQTGSVDIKIEPFERTEVAKFLVDDFNELGTRFPKYELSGSAENGEVFQTDNLIVLSPGDCFFEEYATLSLVTTCSHCALSLQAKRTPTSYVRWKMIGFENPKVLSVLSKLGKVEMVGYYKSDNGLMSDGLVVYHDQPGSYEAWKLKADELLRHVRGIMSFAAARFLTVPIIEVASDETLTVEIFAQSERQSNSYRPFQSRHQQPIFECAVTSFFDKPIEIKGFHFAVEWFTMGSTYPESNLIFAMTALENMLDTNLSSREKSLLSKKAFSGLRAKVFDLLKLEVLNLYAEPDQAAGLADLESKLPELNRKSLLQKLRLLAEKWGVSLAGIEDSGIALAKSARDKVVHRGKYVAPEGSTQDLDDHVRLLRELIVRFVLTAFNYRGKYYTFVGGYTEMQWPPAAPNN